jgi:Outer membrane protein beta-barrel domain
MKTFALALLASVGVAASAFAGYEMNTGKDYSPANPCFHDQEFHVDLFGSYVDTQGGGGSDGFGGGVGLTYFFQRYVGIGVDANLSSADDGLWTFSGSLVARYPLEFGSVCLAPYILGGGGFQTDGTNAGTFHAGGGLEWRATPAFGIYGEGRYIWAGGDDDNTRVALGVRIVF